MPLQTETKHTPGPWRPALKIGLPIVESESGKSIASLTGFTLGELRGENADSVRGEATANAHLIAAAPDLLEALEEIVRVMRANPQTDAITLLDAVECAEAAIRRAKGGE